MEQVIDKVVPEAQEEVNVDRPIQDIAPEKFTTPELKNIFAAQAAGIDSYLTGEDLGTTFQRYQVFAEPEDEAKRLSVQKAAVDSAAITEEYVENPYVGGMSPAANASATQLAKQQAMVDASNPDRQFIESITDSATAALWVDKNAAKMKLYRMLAEEEAKVSLGNHAASLGASVLPLVDTATQAIYTGSLFGSQEVMESRIIRFKELPVEEQEELFPVLRDSLIEHFGEAGGVATLAKFIQPYGEEDLAEFSNYWKILDLVDVVGIGAAVKKYNTGSRLLRELSGEASYLDKVKSNGFRNTNAEYAEKAQSKAEKLDAKILDVTKEVGKKAKNILKTASEADKKALAAEALGKALTVFKEGRTLIKVLKETGNTKKAVDANLEAALDTTGTAARGMNTTVDSSVSSTLPFDVSITDLKAEGGLSTKSIEQLDEFFTGVDKETASIISGDKYLKEGIVSDEDRVLAVAETLAKFKKAGHENIEIFAEGEDFVRISYRSVDEDGNLLDEVFNMELSLDSVGSWEQRVLSPGAELAASPTVWAKNSTRLDVNTAQRLDYTTSKVQAQLNKAMAAAIKPLGSLFKPSTKGRMAKIDKALLEGDVYKMDDGSRGIVFTPDELSGIYKLDEQEIVTYYQLNRVFNDLFNIANASKREEMLALNYKAIMLADNARTFGKIQDTVATGLDSLRKAEVRYILDDTTGAVIKAGGRDGWLEGHYDAGKVLVHLGENYKTKANFVGEVKFALVNRSSVKALPETVLNRKVGYVPRMYDNATYFVKELVPTKIDGMSSHVEKTLRFFSNKADADTYKAQLVAKEVAAGKITAEQAAKKYVALADREVETISTILSDFNKGSGGLYTGARAQEDILFGLEGAVSTRVNAFDSLVRNIGSVSRATSLNAWRLGMEQKWINSVNDYLTEIGAKNRVTNFGNTPDSIANSEAGAFFHKMERQIREWQGFPTREEQLWRTQTQRMMNWAGAKGLGDKVIGVIGSARSKDPIAAARGVAFHSLLGTFNPAHLWIQAQGASVALSLAAGKYSGKVIKNVAAFSALGEEAIQAGSKRFKLAATVSPYKADELEAMYGLWKKTGLGDSVLQTADHAAAIKGMGVVGAAVRKAADKGLMFYRAGELTSRRTAFLTAIERFKEANKLDSIKGISDVQLKGIFDDTNNMMLNMTKANRAGFQKGILSLPTQFLQVTTKSFESTLRLNKNFTKQEAGRIMFGQLALYGTAGVPIASLATNWAIEAGGYTQAELDNNPELVKFINDGFWGVTSHWILGADIELSSRGALVRGGTDLMDRILTAEGSMAGVLLGAAGTTGQRVWDSFAKQLRPITYGVHDPELLDIIKIPTLSVLSGISTWRNGEKAIVMAATNRINDRKGNALLNEDFDLSTTVGAAIGFMPTREATTWDIQERDKYYQSTKKKIVETVIQLQNSYALKVELGTDTEEDYQEIVDNQAFLQTLMSNEIDNQEISKMIRNATLKESAREMAVSRYKDRMMNELVDGVSLYKQILGDKLILLDKPKEDKEEK